jgi:low temperature requirement protein LtrA
VLWWSWVGYAWLTSVVDPEAGAVRGVIFVAMAALLVAALCVPAAFGDLALTFAIAYAVVRAAHIALFVLASRGDDAFRQSVLGLAVSTAVGVGLLIGASFVDGATQGALWALALGLDMAGPYVFSAEGWKLEPGHFAERHGLIMIIALGESIVALGLGAEVGVDGGVIVAAVVGVLLAAGLWWAYFDVVSLIAVGYLSETPAGGERNELARDAYSYLHFPMVAGIVLIALGLKKTLEHVGDPLAVVPATALVGGTAVYLLAHVAFRWRIVHSVSVQRLIAAIVLGALVPVALVVPALATVVGVATLVWLLMLYETIRFARTRERVRHHPETADLVDHPDPHIV